MKIFMAMYGRGIGGAELQFLELAKYLAFKNQVSLVSLGGRGAIDSVGTSSELDIRAYSYSGKMAAFWFLIKALFQSRAEKPDVIVTTSVVGNVFGWVISLFNPEARLVSLQTVSKVIRHDRVDRWVLTRFDTLVAGNDDIKDYLLGRGQARSKIHIVNNWVDFSARRVTAEALATRKKYGIPSECLIVGCIGRMHPQKGQEFLIRSFKDVYKKHKTLRLVLVGDGPLMSSMKEEASDLGQLVTFLGSVTGDEYNNVLNMIDVYVQPSRFEGLPRTLLDAMYLSKPIIATAVNGNCYAIQSDINGLLVPAENEQAIAHALEKLLSNEALAKQLGSAAHNSALENYDMTSQLARIEKLLYVA